MSYMGDYSSFRVQGLNSLKGGSIRDHMGKSYTTKGDARSLDCGYRGCI